MRATRGQPPGRLDRAAGATPDARPSGTSQSENSPVNTAALIVIDGGVEPPAYERLLERTAEDTKSGAGQYFTPRALIDALVRRQKIPDCRAPRAGSPLSS